MRELRKDYDLGSAPVVKPPAPNQAALDLLDRINASNPAGSSAPAGTTDPAAPKLQSWTAGATEKPKPAATVGLQESEPEVKEATKKSKELRLSKGTLSPEQQSRLKTLTVNPQEPDKFEYTPPMMIMGQPATPGQSRVVEAPEPEKPRVAREMTWDRYNALTDVQRDAVDFNTLLVRAREKDLNTDYDPKPRQNQAYYNDLESIFGKGAEAGSHTYAPETLAVLKQIGWRPEKMKLSAKDLMDGEPMPDRLGSDFDDFLNLDVAITGKQLRQATSGAAKENVGVFSPTAGYEAVQKELTERTSVLQEQMAKSGEFLQSFAAGAANMRNELTQGYGGTENKVKVDIGYGGADSDNEYRAIFDLYADKDFETKAGKSMSEGLAVLREGLQMEGKLESFLRYAENRSAQAKDYDLPLGTTERVAYRSPEEFREMLGFDKKEG